MQRMRLVFFASCVVSSMGLAIACGDDDAEVRPRLDAGGGDVVVPDGDVDGGPACTLTPPADYLSAAFETNAKLELDLRTAFSGFLKPMVDAENAQTDGGTITEVTKAQLETLWQGGNPSIKSITTSYYQGRVDGWLGAYEAATDAGAFDLATQGATPPASGGYYGKYVYDPNMIDLRQAIEKGTYTAGFFNHAVGIVSAGNLTEASIDRIVAAWGAHASFQNNHLATAGATAATRDVNSAGYAARRTPKDGATGPYLRAKAAAIKAKAAIAAGPTCAADRDAAIQEFLLEWEKATYATVVFYFNDILTKLSSRPDEATPAGAAAWTGIFHAHGECIGFIAGFKTIPQAYRKITDAQIDALLAKALAPEGGPLKVLELKTATTASAIQLNGALAEIKTVYGFSDAEMESFKLVYTKP